MSTLADHAASASSLREYKSLEDGVLTARIKAVKQRMGQRLLILGHHYQRDEVIALSDLRGDSYQLSALAAANEECRAIAFCGVHFMAETADILANRPQRLAARGGERVAVVLPDLSAGCSMADMAEIEHGALRKNAEINGQTALSTVEKARHAVLVTELSEAQVGMLGGVKAARFQEALEAARSTLAASGRVSPTLLLMPHASYTVPVPPI